MSRADVLNLVNVLSNGQADQYLAVGFYIDAINDLAFKGWLTNVGLAGFTEDGTELALVGTLRKLFGIVYADRQLDEMSLRQLEHLDLRWRDRLGAPRAYTREEETAKTVALYPTPDITAYGWFGIYPPFSIGYPPFEGMVLYSEFRDPVPQHWELILVFKILAREYSRESNHQSDDYAKFAQQMAEILMTMLG